MISLAFDTHVHFYPVFDTAGLLEAAHRNLSRVLQGHHLQDGAPAVLWTRFPRERDIEEDLFGPGCHGWRADPVTREAPGFWVRHPDGRRVFVFRGTQLVSAEGLEVLVAGVYDMSLQQQPVRDIIRYFSPRHAVILPWGVGKWLGQRGRLVQSLLDSDLAGQFVLGDNSARPAWWGPIRAFVQAETSRTRVCPGTDPLPIRGQEQRVGQSGIVLEHADERILSDPEGLREALMPRHPVFKTVFDRRENLLRFIVNQVKIRLP